MLFYGDSLIASFSKTRRPISIKSDTLMDELYCTIEATSEKVRKTLSGREEGSFVSYSIKLLYVINTAYSSGCKKIHASQAMLTLN